MTPRPHIRAFSEFLLAVTALAIVGCSEAEDRPYHGRSAQQWAQRLADSSVSVRVEAAEALYHVAPKNSRVVNALLTAMRDSSAAVQAAVAMTLGTVGDPAIPGLLEAMQDDHASVRATAISIVAAEGGNPATIVPAIMRALGDSTEEVKLQAAQSLGFMGRAAAAAGRALLGAARQSRGILRAASLEAANAVGAESNALRALADSALADSSAAVRHAALRARVRQSTGAADVISVVRRMLGDSDIGVRAAAYRALTSIARDGTSPANAEARRILEAGTTDPSEIVRTTAAEALAPPRQVRDPDWRYGPRP